MMPVYGWVNRAVREQVLGNLLRGGGRDGEADRHRSGLRREIGRSAIPPISASCSWVIPKPKPVSAHLVPEHAILPMTDTRPQRPLSAHVDKSAIRRLKQQHLSPRYDTAVNGRPVACQLLDTCLATVGTLPHTSKRAGAD